MHRYLRPEGVVVEAVGHLWAAFMPVSGETSLLNDESAAILDVLLEGPADTDEVCLRLAADSDLLPAEMAAAVAACWQQLVDVGAVRPVIDSPASRP